MELARCWHSSKTEDHKEDLLFVSAGKITVMRPLEKYNLIGRAPDPFTDSRTEGSGPTISNEGSPEDEDSTEIL